MELLFVNPKTLKLNPDNPRRTKASPEADAALAANIKIIGLIQPPRVRRVDTELIVIAGDRRVKASIAARLKEIPILVGDEEDTADALRSLAENVQRAQMGPVDQWRAIEGLCGSDWSEEAIALAFGMTARTIRKLRLLAKILPAMLDRMAYDLPAEGDLRSIANAPLEEQEQVWKANKPPRGESPHWPSIADALTKETLSARVARFDDETAIAFGVRWEDDLFGPGDQDNRTTTDVEQFLAAQLHWATTTLPENGVILETGQWSSVTLPPHAERAWGEPREGDKLGRFIDPRTAEVKEIGLRLYERSDSASVSARGLVSDGIDRPKAPRPPLSTKGVERIGDMRTDALHTGLREAEIDDTKLLGLLIIALGGRNVEAQSAASPEIAPRYRTFGTRGARGEIARRLIEAGHLTSDLGLLRAAARDMLVQVLSCREGMSHSGVVARVAGDAIGADAFLPSMAEDDFLKTLSKDAITAVVQAADILPRNTAKEMRAALIEQVGKGHYVLPAARFRLEPAELATLQKDIAADCAPPPQHVEEEDVTDEGEDGRDEEREGDDPEMGDLSVAA